MPISFFLFLYLLDLSFNNIEVIEGLEKLTKLEDLTLFNNRIQLLENMDSFPNLHVFSIGNNNLSSLENVSPTFSLVTWPCLLFIRTTLNFHMIN